MLADNLAVTDMNGRHIRGWLDLFLPPGLRQAPTWALLVCDGPELLHAVVSGRGAVPVAEIGYEGSSRKKLAALRERLDLDAALVVTPETFDQIAAGAERGVRLEEHYTAQALHWLTALRSQNRRGLWLEPPLLDLVPPLSTDALERAFKLFVPDGSSLAAYVISDDRKRVDASIIALAENGRISAVSTHDVIADRLSEETLARSWTSQYPQALDLIADRFRPASAAVFIERAAVRRILSGPPDQLSRELKNRTAIIDPMPRWLQGLLGGAAAVAVASRGAKRLGSLLPRRARQAAASVAESASRRAKESGAHPWQVLGFDPIELFRNLQRYYRD